MIIFPAKAQEALLNNSVNINSNSTSHTGKIAKRATKEEAINSNTTMDNTTVTSEEGNSSFVLSGEKHVEIDNTTHANPRKYDDDFFVQSTQGLKANESLKPTIAEESVNSTEELSTNTTTGAQPPQTFIEDAESNQTTSNNYTTPVASDVSTVATSTQSPVAITTSARIVASTTTVPLTASTTLKPDVSEKAENKVHVNQILSSECYYALRNYLDAVLPETKEDVILIPSLVRN